MSALPTIVSKEELVARQCDEELRSAAGSIRGGLIKLAYFGWRIRKVEGWKQLGFKTEDEYRISVRIPRASWYRAITVGKAFEALSLEELRSVSFNNLEVLVRVNPALWHDYPWIEEAKKLSSTQLYNLVKKRNGPRLTREFKSQYRCLAPSPVIQFIKASVEGFRKENNLATPAEALEMLVSENYDRAKLLGAAIGARDILKRFVTRYSVATMNKRDRTELRTAISILNEAISGERKTEDYNSEATLPN